ncbi:hypothetical protein AaE_015427 [Aphanomyces astaci]|uniref:Uncharacterized protein n=1 Tax=Aphanomyces astaci TaxID=112090 RepID=A0A6A4Z1C3_APHAT|nr:hypothetical protein AaE_015427 [Aphanomyces astaci]
MFNQVGVRGPCRFHYGTRKSDLLRQVRFNERTSSASAFIHTWLAQLTTAKAPADQPHQAHGTVFFDGQRSPRVAVTRVFSFHPSSTQHRIAQSQEEQSSRGPGVVPGRDVELFEYSRFGANTRDESPAAYPSVHPLRNEFKRHRHRLDGRDIAVQDYEAHVGAIGVFDFLGDIGQFSVGKTG